MPDPTAARRVAAYRVRQAAERGFDRAEVRVATRDRAIIQRVSADLRSRRNALRGNAALDFIVRTINAPRPVPIDGDTLLDCLLSDTPIEVWQPHIEAFFTEVSIEATHDLVLSGLCNFDDLRKAQRVWGPYRGEKHDWIDDMANLSLERDARRRAAHPAQPPSGQ
jgi:hypothetical protein